MSVPDPGPSRRHAARPPHQADAGTDPGRSQPFESLYRSTASGPRTHRTTARHFEPWLNPPEEEPDAGDTFGWLYRKESEPSVEAAPHLPGSSAGASTALTPGPRPPAPRADPQPAAATSSPLSTARRRRRHAGWLVFLLVLLAAMGGVGVLLLSGDLSTLASTVFYALRDR